MADRSIEDYLAVIEFEKMINMGYDYEDAWDELYTLFEELPLNTESEIPFDDKGRRWILEKMSEIEKKIT